MLRQGPRERGTPPASCILLANGLLRTMAVRGVGISMLRRVGLLSGYLSWECGAMGVVRLCRLGLAAVIVLVAILGAGAQAPAQDRARIEVVPTIPHSEQVTSLAFSPDGGRVLSGSEDKTAKLWDTATGALLRTFEGHSDVVSSVAFSLD